MLVLKACRQPFNPTFAFCSSKLQRAASCMRNQVEKLKDRRRYGKRLVVRGCQGEKKKSERRSFLSLEEASLIEISGLSTHERLLCRLTISSLNPLKVISEKEGYPIEELNAGRICDWFVKDKLKRAESGLCSAAMDDSGVQISPRDVA